MLKYFEQEILHNMYEVLAENPTSNFQLQFAPRWILRKAIEAEKENYRKEGAYKEVEYKSFPPNVNVNSSHHFFELRFSEDAGELRLKYRLVPHGNREKDKHTVRTHSSIEQFPIIRVVLTIAAILRFRLSSIYIKQSYLKAVDFPRNVYMRPPNG